MSKLILSAVLALLLSGCAEMKLNRDGELMIARDATAAPHEFGARINQKF